MPSEAQCSRSAGGRFDEIAAIELVVAGDEHDRHRPAAKAVERVPAAVDVAGEHQQLGARRRLGVVALGLEVQVGEQLQPHQRAAAEAAPWHCLNLRPLPHGHGSLRPTLGASRRNASTL